MVEDSQAVQEQQCPLSPGSSSALTEAPVKVGGVQGPAPSPGLDTPGAWPEGATVFRIHNDQI